MNLYAYPEGDSRIPFINAGLFRGELAMQLSRIVPIDIPSRELYYDM